MATQRAIAERAGVSAAVVSAVVNGTHHTRMTDETRARVLHVLDELKYVPNQAARSLRRQRTGMIGVVLDKIENPVYQPMLTGIYQSATAHDSSVLLGDRERMQSGSRHLRHMLSHGTVDGILVPAAGDFDRDILEDLAARPIPVVGLEPDIDETRPWVGVDNVAGGRMATNFLINLGHRRIAYVGGGLWYSSSLRFQGYLAAMQAARLEPMDQIETGFGIEAGAKALHQALGMSSLPTALVIHSVMSCVGVLSAAHDVGLDIPRQLSVIGIHDMPLAEYLRPRITVVRMPMYALGVAAADAVFALREGEQPRLGLLDEAPVTVARDSTTGPR